MKSKFQVDFPLSRDLVRPFSLAAATVMWQLMGGTTTLLMFLSLSVVLSYIVGSLWALTVIAILIMLIWFGLPVGAFSSLRKRLMLEVANGRQVSYRFDDNQIAEMTEKGREVLGYEDIASFVVTKDSYVLATKKLELVLLPKRYLPTELAGYLESHFSIKRAALTHKKVRSGLSTQEIQKELGWKLRLAWGGLILGATAPLALGAGWMVVSVILACSSFVLGLDTANLVLDCERFRDLRMGKAKFLANALMLVSFVELVVLEYFRFSGS